MFNDGSSWTLGGASESSTQWVRRQACHRLSGKGDVCSCWRGRAGFVEGVELWTRWVGFGHGVSVRHSGWGETRRKIQRKENAGSFKRRVVNPGNCSCRRKGSSDGKRRLRLEVVWEIRLRSWYTYCVIKRRCWRLSGIYFVLNQSGHQDSQQFMLPKIVCFFFGYLSENDLI